MIINKGSYVSELRGMRKAFYILIPSYRKWLNSIGVKYEEQ